MTLLVDLKVNSPFDDKSFPSAGNLAVCPKGYPGWQQRNHHAFASLALCKMANMSRRTCVQLNPIQYWPFVLGIHWYMLDSPYKGAVMQKLFVCHDIIKENVMHSSVQS